MMVGHTCLVGGVNTSGTLALPERLMFFIIYSDGTTPGNTYPDTNPQR